MNDHRVSPAVDVSPETRQHLAAGARRELDALRAELDRCLSALEAALAHPDSRTSLADLVLDLARVATAEAEAAAARAALEAQLLAQERADAAASDAQRALDAERAIAKGLGQDLDRTRTEVSAAREAAAQLQQEFKSVRHSLEQERLQNAEAMRNLERARAELGDAGDAAAQLREEINGVRQSLEQERQTSDEVRRELEQARAALQDALAGGAALRSQAADREQSLHQEGERHAALESELARQRDAAAQMSQALADLRCELEAAQRAADGRTDDAAAQRAGVESLQHRAAELDRQRLAAVERAAEADSAREGLAEALDVARREAATAKASVDTLVAAADGERAEAERSIRDAEERANKASAERTDAERRIRDAEEQANKASAERDEFAARLEAEKKSIQGIRDAVKARIVAIDAKHARTVKAWEQADARAEAAGKERDALAVELSAAQQTTKPDAIVARRLESANERIRVLELMLRERDKAPSDADVDLASALEATPSVPSEQSGQRAKRYAFSPKTAVHIDRDKGVLVDLSVTGAQVICGTSPEVGRIVTVTLASDEAPCFCQGRLLWARREQPSKSQPLRYRVGLVFTAVDEAAIQAFIAQHSIA